MKQLTFTFLFATVMLAASAQISPTVYSWLQNTTETGSYYTANNPNVIQNNILVNCQNVAYTADFVYVTTEGVPAYPTGPFQDGNPSQASAQSVIFEIPLNPVANPGTPIETNPGNIGVFINGVALFDWRDGVAWNPLTNDICGGPGNTPCPGGPMAEMDWNRDAIPAELPGFDCSKGHPAMGNYHHHQNPSAFKLDLNVLSDVCDVHDANGLYTIDANSHSPLIGFAYDGFPIYGAYGFQNTDGTGGVVRIKSSYQQRAITVRNTHADGSAVDNGPAVGGDYPIGYFREDYEYVANPAEDYLDVHNGRFCVTPEYPNGTYAYFATVDENWNSTYPYVVGPTFYGTPDDRTTNAVPGDAVVYTGSTNLTEVEFNALDVSVFPNPSSDFVVIQMEGLVKDDLVIELIDITGRLVNSTKILKGSTLAYFDLQTVYMGTYFVKISSNGYSKVEKIIVD